MTTRDAEATIVERTDQGPTFDPDALREKYREERDRHLRADGNEQYVEVKGLFAHFLDDPYIGPRSSAPKGPSAAGA